MQHRKTHTHTHTHTHTQTVGCGQVKVIFTILYTRSFLSNVIIETFEIQENLERKETKSILLKFEELCFKCYNREIISKFKEM